MHIKSYINVLYISWSEHTDLWRFMAMTHKNDALLSR